MKNILSRLPSLPRFSDDKQRRAGGNIIKFLAALLALTLIARGTSGATLPRVELESPTRAEIVEAVSGTASVSARDTLDITAPDGLTITEIFVGAGQTVKNGDAVALFDPDEVQEKLIRETASLDKLLLDLEKLERGENADSYSLESAERTLRRAQEDYETTRKQGEADVEAAKLALEEAWADVADDPDTYSLESARRTLQRAQEDYESARKQGEKDIAAAQEALDKALATEIETTNSEALDKAETNLENAQRSYDTNNSYLDAQVRAAETAYQNALNNQNAKQAIYESATDPADIAAAEAELNAAQAETARAKSALDAARNSQANAQLGLMEAQSAYDKALDAYSESYEKAHKTWQDAVDKAEDALESAKSKAADNLLSAARRVEDAQASYDKSEQDFAKNAQQSADSLLSEIERAEDALESAETKAADNLLSARRRVEDAQASLSKAKQDFGKSERQASDTVEQNSITAVGMRLDIDAQKEIVDALQLLLNNDCVLYTDLEGIVSYAKPEGGVTDKNALVSFMDGAKGFEAQFQTTKTDADRLAVGDECEVTTGGGGMYYNPTVTGTVSAISAPDESDRVTVTVRLPAGDWTSGQRVEIQAVQSRDTYDMCVPLSALHSDNSGYYLLTVSQKSSVLGVENIVTRVTVTVNASDENMAAVQGPIGRDSEVITGSSKAIAEGDRVRVSD